MGKCINLADACLTYDQEADKCTSCVQGWGLDPATSQCKSCPANSLDCNDGTVTCEAYRYFDETKYECLTCDASCEECEMNTGICTVCENAFNLSSDIDPKTCISCRAKYGLNCLSCTKGIHGVCQQCVAGWLLNSEVTFLS
jgi:hypothetical protein